MDNACTRLYCTYGKTLGLCFVRRDYTQGYVCDVLLPLSLSQSHPNPQPPPPSGDPLQTLQHSSVPTITTHTRPLDPRPHTLPVYTVQGQG